MSRKSKTVVTFNLKLVLPSNVTVPQMREFIKSELAAMEILGGPEPQYLDMTELTLALVKKETHYG